MWNKKEMSQLDVTLTRVPLTLTFDFALWPWKSRSNCISGMGGSIVMEGKGQESSGCPDVKHNHYVTLRQRILLPTGWLKISAFPSTRSSFQLVCTITHYPFKLGSQKLDQRCRIAWLRTLLFWVAIDQVLNPSDRHPLDIDPTLPHQIEI